MLKRKAFTLIELLVAVAIIVALLAILMPSMSQAIEAGHRAVCASNLHQQQLAAVSFATDRLGALPQDTHGKWVPGLGAGAIWMRENIYNRPDTGKFSGQGILINKGYLPRDGVVLYCPSFTYPHLALESFTGYYNGGGWRADVADAYAETQNFMMCSYVYRNKILDGGAWREMRINASPNEPIVADHFSFRPSEVSPYHMAVPTTSRPISEGPWYR